MAVSFVLEASLPRGSIFSMALQPASYRFMAVGCSALPTPVYFDVRNDFLGCFQISDKSF